MNKLTTIVAAFAATSLTASAALASPSESLATTEAKPKSGAILTIDNALETFESAKDESIRFEDISFAETENFRTSPVKEASKETDPRSNFIDRPGPGETAEKEGDINRDGLVNVDDLMLVLQFWGPKERGELSPGDIAPKGGDFKVDFDDMLVVLMNWGL